MVIEDPHHLSKRERQVMEIIYERGKATAMEIHQTLLNPPSYSAVRGMLRVLEEKGLVNHTHAGKRNLYKPTITTEKAGRSALKNLVKTFFSGSPAKAVATLLDISKTDFSESALDRLKEMIDRAKEEGN